MLAAISLVDTIVGHQQIVDAGHECFLAAGELDLLDRDVSDENAGVIG